MLYDFDPIIIENFFSKEEFDLIYNHLYSFGLDEFLNNEDTDKDTSYFKNIEDVGYCAFSYKWPDIVLDKVKKNAYEKTQNAVNDLQMHFARYSNKTNSKPQLLPHSDRFVENPSYTMSVQLKTSVPEWKIFVDDFETNINSNSAILFSGTHQIHFREPKTLSNDDFCDILVCQIKLDGYNFDKNHNYIMNLKQKLGMIKYENLNKFLK